MFQKSGITDDLCKYNSEGIRAISVLWGLSEKFLGGRCDRPFQPHTMTCLHLLQTHVESRHSDSCLQCRGLTVNRFSARISKGGPSCDAQRFLNREEKIWDVPRRQGKCVCVFLTRRSLIAEKLTHEFQGQSLLTSNCMKVYGTVFSQICL